MTTTPQSMSDLPELPEPAINTANHASVRVIGYTADQLREYGRLCRATAEQAGKVEVEKRVFGRLDPGEHSIGAGPFRIGIDGGDDGWCIVITRGRTIVAMVDDAKPTQPAAPKGWEAGKVYAASREVIVGTGIPMPAAPVSPSREVEALAGHMMMLSAGDKLLNRVDCRKLREVAAILRNLAPVQEKAP